MYVNKQQTLAHEIIDLGRLLVILVFALCFVPINGQAAEENLNFYVTPEFPDSQVEESSSYFNLNLAAGRTERLVLKLQNGSNTSKQIQITPHTAYTNVQGVVEYGQDAEIPDTSLVYSLADLIEGPDKVELAGKETKTVTLTLRMPDEEFRGFLAGGLRITELKEEEESTSSSEEGVAIKNEFAYVVGVIVSNSRDVVKPELELLDVFADQLNYRNVISATIQNFTATFVNRMTVDATVKRKNEDEVLYEAHEEMMQMAPNSNFNFPISLEGERFRSGNYIIKMKATSGENEWEWEREFTIDTETAQELNQADVTIDTSVNWWMIGTFSLIVVLVGIVLYLIIQRKKACEHKPKD